MNKNNDIYNMLTEKERQTIENLTILQTLK